MFVNAVHLTHLNSDLQQFRLEAFYHFCTAKNFWGALYNAVHMFLLCIFSHQFSVMLLQNLMRESLSHLHSKCLFIFKNVASDLFCYSSLFVVKSVFQYVNKIALYILS